MTSMSNQPFLLSLAQAANQKGNYKVYRTLLHDQQNQFKDYVNDYFDADMSARNLFLFLKKADYELLHIQHEYDDIVSESDTAFYHYWTMMIEDTRQFVSIGFKTLQFQARCPASMLEEGHSHPFPHCNWTAHRSDLMEAIVGFFQADVIRMQDGSRPSFALFAKEIGEVFGVTFSNPYFEMQKILNRKKNQTPFLTRVISSIKKKSGEGNL